MCYLCKQPVKDYTHFYGQGGAPTPTKTCPLWTDNKRLHEQEVANAAAKAKEELAAQNPNLKLKHDPTKGIKIPAQPVNHQGQVTIPWSTHKSFFSSVLSSGSWLGRCDCTRGAKGGDCKTTALH